jgi:hypothetical protein
MAIKKSIFWGRGNVGACSFHTSQYFFMAFWEKVGLMIGKLPAKLQYHRFYRFLQRHPLRQPLEIPQKRPQ